MNTIKNICDMMKDAGLESVGFLFHNTKPSIQKEGIKYEILSIDDNEDGRIRITGIPSYGWSLAHLYVDESWNQKTLDKITRIVKEKVEQFQ